MHLLTDEDDYVCVMCVRAKIYGFHCTCVAKFFPNYKQKIEINVSFRLDYRLLGVNENVFRCK